jgi:hypothetical protein
MHMFRVFGLMAGLTILLVLFGQWFGGSQGAVSQAIGRNFGSPRGRRGFPADGRGRAGSASAA